MATAEAPGRPENLTPEQEEKLREFWSVLLGVFGLIAKSELNNTDGGQDHAASNADVEYSSIDTSTKTGTTDTDVVKKRHRGLFSRKASKGLSDESVDDSSNGDGSGHHKINTRGAEDKYGQTRDFKAALSSQSPEELRAAFWTMLKHDHPDALLLRFLRARKWDIEKALVMLISTMHWRANEMHVDDDIMRIGESGALNSSLAATGTAKVEGEEFLNQLRLGKSFLHGVDKTGRPVCIVRVRLHKQGDQSEKTVERYTVYVIETARLLLRGPIDTAAIIFDMTGFSLANMDYQPVKFMIKCFEANYPESLGVVLVHKAPWVFQGIWNIIKGWLDPVVASKINFTKSVEDLEQFIPRSQILKELGGEEDWTYNFIEPGTKEDIQMSDSSTQSAIQAERDAMVTKFEKMTIAWINARDSKPSNDVKLERDIIAKALAENYWKIDPYTRARSLYDRIGVIKSGGLLDFYPDGTSPQSRTHDELD
ncbi:MAG: hypothetical protein M1825_001557 [Sarcosagium campestre]|nr:MAG: hypothetical protein M1825_001557 [Sarcosagium campestre]